MNFRNEDLVGEVVGVVAAQYLKKMGKPLDVTVSNQLKARSGKNSKPVNILSSGTNATFSRNKDGTIIYN